MALCACSPTLCRSLSPGTKHVTALKPALAGRAGAGLGAGTGAAGMPLSRLNVGTELKPIPVKGSL